MIIDSGRPSSWTHVDSPQTRSGTLPFAQAVPQRRSTHAATSRLTIVLIAVLHRNRARGSGDRVPAVLDPKVFKAYDVRGLYPTELDEEGAYAIGRAYVEQFEPKRIAVGRDMRLSSPSMARAFIDGAADGGADVLDLGLVGTEMVRSEEHTSELQSLAYLVCRLLLEKKK